MKNLLKLVSVLALVASSVSFAMPAKEEPKKEDVKTEATTTEEVKSEKVEEKK